MESENPDASSADEIAAVKSRKGQKRAPTSSTSASPSPAAAPRGLFAPYKVEAWDKIPAGQKDEAGRWYNDYGGYVSIGCDAKRIPNCPTTFADLLKPEYKGKVALNGNPTKSGSAFGGVYAAALARKGSFADIQPGIDFFGELKKSGNFIPVESTPATVEKGETPISIDWDYLNAGYADQFRSKGVDWKVAVPTDGVYAQYYSQAINKDAPTRRPPACGWSSSTAPRARTSGSRGTPARPAPGHDRRRHRRQDLRRQAPEGRGTPPSVLLRTRQGQGHPRREVGQGRLLMSSASSTPTTGPPPRRRPPPPREPPAAPAAGGGARTWLAALPLIAFTALSFGLPLGALVYGAVTRTDPATGATTATGEHLGRSSRAPTWAP